MASKGKILYLVAEDWYFCSHRLQLACAARDEGYEVVVATRVTAHGDEITKSGLKLIPINMCRSGLNPLSELPSLLHLIRIYRQERPDLVHHVALKPVIYGSLAAAVTAIPAKINALGGLGFAYSSESKKARLLRAMLRVVLRMLLNRSNSKVILQNNDDLETLVNASILKPDRAAVIRGAGVDLQEFSLSAEPDEPPVVMLASRMLWSKGVGEFVEAASLLNKRGVVARYILVGEADAVNPASIPREQLLKWQQEGVVEWWGRRDDMADVLRQAHIVCLPSYREGLPKVLLEAAASGRAIVASDAPGCREVVHHNENGLLIPVKKSVPLADAIEQLVSDPVLRRKMGARGREIVVEGLSLEQVVSETLALYREGIIGSNANRSSS
ncbi:MAG TPA: glycosyltransferase family 1 protein [Chromatiales bacterium]|nr:glycosyltransferase family 1 protein [Chromatiales bacterium]